MLSSAVTPNVHPVAASRPRNPRYLPAHIRLGGMIPVVLHALVGRWDSW